MELRLRERRLLRLSRARRARASDQSSRAQGVDTRQRRPVEHAAPAGRRRMRPRRRARDGETLVQDQSKILSLI